VPRLYFFSSVVESDEKMLFFKHAESYEFTKIFIGSLRSNLMT